MSCSTVCKGLLSGWFWSAPGQVSPDSLYKGVNQGTDRGKVPWPQLRRQHAVELGFNAPVTAPHPASALSPSPHAHSSPLIPSSLSLLFPLAKHLSSRVSTLGQSFYLQDEFHLEETALSVNGIFPSEALLHTFHHSSLFYLEPNSSFHMDNYTLLWLSPFSSPQHFPIYYLVLS